MHGDDCECLYTTQASINSLVYESQYMIQLFLEFSLYRVSLCPIHIPYQNCSCILFTLNLTCVYIVMPKAATLERNICKSSHVWASSCDMISQWNWWLFEHPHPLLLLSRYYSVVVLPSCRYHVLSYRHALNVLCCNNSKNNLGRYNTYHLRWICIGTKNGYWHTFVLQCRDTFSKSLHFIFYAIGDSTQLGRCYFREVSL